MSLQPVSPTPPIPAGPSRSRRPSDALAWLGGADREVLELAQSGRNQFIQMGLVVLATAGLGMVSMSFALYSGLHLPLVPAVCGGLIWGCIIAVIDRFLITSLNLRGGLGQVVVIVGLRVAIAAVLGVVISTPLVLQVFQQEINAQILETNTANNTSFGDALAITPDAEQLARVRAEIATHEAALRGDVPPVETPEVKARQEYLAQAQATLTALRTESDQKYRAWQCEQYGGSCEGSTADPGNGLLAQAREREYRAALEQTNAAQRNVDEAETELAAAREAASAQDDEALKHAQDRANEALPSLRDRERELQSTFDKALDAGSQTNRDNNGILAQIIALNDLGEGSFEARMTHILVGLLFFMIELLPVLVKILSSLGPPTAYERVRDMIEDAKTDNAKIKQRRETRLRDEQERRIAEEDKKRNAIEDDMRTRERDLGIKANARVADEMEGVLDVALAQWAQKVQNTLYTTSAAAQSGAAPAPGVAATGSPAPPPPSGNGAAPSGGTTPSSGGAPPSGPTLPVQQNLRNNFNLPSGKKLGSSPGGTP